MPIYHFSTQYEPKDHEAKERQRVAKITWSTQLWTEIPIRDKDLPRMWREEGREFPYIRDIFDFACKQLNDQDIACYSNSDIMVRSDCALAIAERLQETDAAYCFRRDFPNPVSEPIPDDVIERGHDYVGSDLYAFRVAWWKSNRLAMADLIAGLEAWDCIMRYVMDLTNPGKPTVLKNLIAHVRHDSYWERAENRYRLLGQKYCLKTAAAWLRTHGIDPSSHGIIIPL